MSNASQPTGTLDVAMQHAGGLLKTDPSLAAEQAQEILRVAPGYPPATLLLAAARRSLGKRDEAIDMLNTLIREQPRWAAAHFERAQTLAAIGRGDEAIEALKRTVQLKPDHTDAWRVLADHLVAIGDTHGGDAAYARHIQNSTRNPLLQKAAAAMVENDVAQAESLLKQYLLQMPTDVAAIRMLAEVAVRCARDSEAEHLILRCLELAPGFAAARYNYAVLLHRRNDSQAALTQIEQCLEHDPNSPSYRNLCAVILSRVGEYERSIAIYAKLLREYPANPKVWLSYGHVLKTEGQRDACIEAYRESIRQSPSFGEAYWSLANMKTLVFSDDDFAAMHGQIDDPELNDQDRWHFEFALGKAYEDSNDYARSFEHYASGNALYRVAHEYSADINTHRAQRLKNDFSAEFFTARAGSGCTNPDPIFIVGMPRSGSTLLEQILSCHSAVEGTTELPDIITIAQELREEASSRDVAVYAGALAKKNPDELRALGELYIERTRIHRKTERPFFIDKMPNNFMHVGLIHQILPNAKIIDARRHPLGCCFSNFKQFYARGQNFSYDLADMGRFYADYVELMAHFDAVLPPQRVHRVLYEDTVADTERVVRGLLDYCGLAFEPECLRFFESKRPVRTASSEQVRQPIYSAGVEQWRNYEDWLGSLKSALGPVLDAWPAAPDA